MESASQQLALALFEDLGRRGETVERAPKDLGFRRSNAFIKITDLSLAGWRFIDVAYFFVSEDKEHHTEYRVDFQLFKWLMATTTNNRGHFRKLIREAQQAAIELNEIDEDEPSKDRYGAIPLMGEAFIVNGEFIFELSKRLQRAIKDPGASHFLSLRYVFKSIHSKVLYNHLQPFMAEGITPWYDVQVLREMLECSKNKTYDLFKHFRSKVLDVAITEIREVTGLNVEMVTRNVQGSKRIGAIRFRLNVPEQAEQKTAFIVLRALYETLYKEFALSQAEFNEIIANRATYTDERIQQAIDYTRHQVVAGKVKLRAGGYFMKALKEGYLIGTLDQQIHQRAASEDATRKAQQEEASARAESMRIAAEGRERQQIELGWETYNELAPDAQREALHDFCASPTSKMLANSLAVKPAELREHLSEPRVRSSFGVFMAARIARAAKAAAQAAAAGAAPAKQLF